MRSIIVDDEVNSIDVLHLLLMKHCPQVSIVHVTTDFEEAKLKINELKPALLFLDIHLQNQTGFELMNDLEFIPAVIFTTAYDHFAVTAFRHNAIDYLLKPIAVDELIVSVDKAEKHIGHSPKIEKNISYIEQVSIGTPEGILFLKVHDIIRLEADGGYTLIYKLDGSKFIVSKNLGSFDKTFEFSTCKRVHKSHLVNLRHVVRLNKANRFVEMVNGDLVPIPREKIDDFLELIEKFNKSNSNND